MIPIEELKKLKAFHNNPKIKAKYLKRVKAHEKADAIIKGTYWESGKGCAVGCTIEGRDHKLYETELGIPESIAWLEDCLFETMPNEDAKTFPRRFLESITVGVNLSLIAPKFIVYVLDDVLKYCGDNEECKKAIIEVSKLWQSVIRGKIPKESAWSAARSAAWSAAWSAARSAAWSAAWSAARSAAWSAARSAAWSAAWSAAESAVGKKYGDELIKILKEAK